MDKAEIEQRAHEPKQESEDQRSSRAHPVLAGPIEKYLIENERAAVGRSQHNGTFPPRTYGASRLGLFSFQCARNLPFLIPEASFLKLLAELSEAIRIFSIGEQFQTPCCCNSPQCRKGLWFEECSIDVRAVAKVCAAEVRAAEVRAVQVGAAQVRAVQVRVEKLCVAEVRAVQVRAAQDRAVQVRSDSSFPPDRSHSLCFPRISSRSERFRVFPEASFHSKLFCAWLVR